MEVGGGRLHAINQQSPSSKAPRKERSTATAPLYQEFREPNIELASAAAAVATAAAAAAWILLQGGKQKEGYSGFATSVIWQEVTARGRRGGDPV